MNHHSCEISIFRAVDLLHNFLVSTKVKASVSMPSRVPTTAKIILGLAVICELVKIQKTASWSLSELTTTPDVTLDILIEKEEVSQLFLEYVCFEGVM
jgi:hypothetical protein